MRLGVYFSDAVPLEIEAVPMAIPLSRNCTVPPAPLARLAERVANPPITKLFDDVAEETFALALPMVNESVDDFEPLKLALSPEYWA